MITDTQIREAAQRVALQNGLNKTHESQFTRMAKAFLAEVTPSIQESCRANERKRIAAILDSEAADKREDVARGLAFDSGLPIEEAISILERAPKAQAKTNVLSELMKTRAPGISSDDGSPGEGAASGEQKFQDTDAVYAKRAEQVKAKG